MAISMFHSAVGGPLLTASATGQCCHSLHTMERDLRPIIGMVVGTLFPFNDRCHLFHGRFSRGPRVCWKRLELTPHDMFLLLSLLHSAPLVEQNRTDQNMLREYVQQSMFSSLYYFPSHYYFCRLPHWPTSSTTTS